MAIINTELLEKIKNTIRLNKYEAKIWISLLSRGIATAGELADISGVPRSRCYDVLDCLEKKSFVITKLGKPIKYIAVEPEEVIKRYRKAINQEVERKIKFIDSIKGTDTFNELKLLYKTGIEKINIEEISTSIKGKSEINKTIKQMLARAKKSVTIVTTEGDFKKKLKLLNKIIPHPRKKGINVEIAAPLNKPVSSGNGYKIRKLNTNARFISIDSEEALFMTADENVNPENDAGVFIKSGFFTKAIESMFRSNME